MNPVDIILLLLIAAAFTAAVVFCIRTRGKGCSCSRCGSCKGCGMYKGK